MDRHKKFGLICVPALFLVMGCLVLYGRAIYFDMMRWDDTTHILENPYLYQPWSWAKFFDVWKHAYFGLYIPLTYSIWGVIKVWTIAPAAYHGLNVSVHMFNGILVYGILRQLSLNPKGAWMGSAFFLAHPLCVEPVAWISGFKDVGSLFWGLCFLYLLIAVNIRPLGRYLLAFICYLGAVLSKPSGVIFPLVAALLLLYPKSKVVGQCAKDGWGGLTKEAKGRFFFIMFVALTALPVTLYAMSLQPAPYIHELVVWWKRPLVALDALGFYAQKVLWPVDTLADYGRTPSSLWLKASWWSVLLGALLLLVLITSLFRREYIGLGLGIFIVALLPNLGLVPFSFQDHSTVADRYAYAALLGVALTVGHLAERRVYFGLCGLWLLFLVVLTARYIPKWQDQKTLFHYVLAHNPQSVVALDGLGVDAYRRGEVQVAEDFFRQSLDRHPGSAKGWFNLGSALWLRGETKDAIKALEKSLAIDPNHPDTLNNLGFAYAATGQDQAAETLLRKALWINRYDLDARFNLARLLSKRGFEPEARQLLDEAAKIDPNFKQKYKESSL